MKLILLRFVSSDFNCCNTNSKVEGFASSFFNVIFFFFYRFRFWFVILLFSFSFMIRLLHAYYGSTFIVIIFFSQCVEPSKYVVIIFVKKMIKCFLFFQLLRMLNVTCLCSMSHVSHACYMNDLYKFKFFFALKLHVLVKTYISKQTPSYLELVAGKRDFKMRFYGNRKKFGN